jgi:ornithine--oxo-acid transaminase
VEKVNFPKSSEAAIELEKKFGSFNYAPLPFVFAKGKGVYLWDPEGNRYLDFVSGFSAVSQGHCHPRIVKAIQEQAETLTLVSRALYSDQFGAFAEFITKLLGYERVLMMNTGAEAFDTGVKLARKWGYETKKIPAGMAKVIVCEENFHGRTMAAVSASTNSAHHGFFGPVMDGFVRIPFNDLGALENALKDPHVAAFVTEPIQAEAGIRVPADGYLKKVSELCKKANVIFIADEIQTGLARTGKMLCVQHEQVRADVVLLGKALSGGTMPVSAVVADEALLKHLQPGDHGSTFGGNPLACHVAIASLQVIVEEKLAENAEKMGAIFRSAVKDLGSPLISDVRGKGLLNAVVLNFGGDAKKDVEFSIALKEAGLIAKSARPNVFRFAPPLVIEERQILEAVEILRKVIARF